MNPVLLDQHIAVAKRLLYTLDCPRALTISIMLDHGMFKEILDLTVHFGLKSDEFFRHYQATKLLSKAKWLPTGIDKRAAAILTFEDAESTCRAVNQIFSSVRSGDACFMHPSSGNLVFKVRRKIAQVLGSVNYSWVADCNFGPGADQSTKAGLTAAYNKLGSQGSCTPSLLPYLSAYIENSRLVRTWQWDLETRLPLVETTSSNKVTFVPKSSKTDRSIAVEPRWNIFFQKGIGRYIRRRLLRFGVDLNDQTKNQELARRGSHTGKYATIDLKSASDTVAREVIWELLPPHWATLLDDLRSKTGTLQKKTFVYEKWSSMGNGYTFELESLLFFAICSAYSDDISVYGDDLIVPTEHYHEIVDALFFFGFTTNKEKSFVAGPFRESCGGDFFMGAPCTPIYWKESLDDKGTLRLVNQVNVLATRLSDDSCRHWGLRRVHSDLVRRLPNYFQHRGPSTIASCVHDSSEFWTKRRRFGWDGWFVTVCQPVAIRFGFRNYDAAVGHVLLSPSSDGYSVRDRTRLKKIEVFVPSNGYKEIGPWTN